MTICAQMQTEGRKAGLGQVFRALLYAWDHIDVWDPECDLALRELLRDALWLQGRAERNSSPGSKTVNPPRVSVEDNGCGGSNRASAAAAPGDDPVFALSHEKRRVLSGHITFRNDLSGYLSTPADPEGIHQSDLVAGEEVIADDPDSGTPTHIENDPTEQ